MGRSRVAGTGKPVPSWTGFQMEVSTLGLARGRPPSGGDLPHHPSWGVAVFVASSVANNADLGWLLPENDVTFQII